MEKKLGHSLTYKVIDDCIPKDLQKKYLEISEGIHWIYNKTCIHPLIVPIENATTFDVGQLTCKVPEDDYDLFLPLLDNFGKYSKINRIKYNLLWRCSEANNRHTSLHHDGDTDCLSAVYYVNDSDGETIIIDGEDEYRIHPKKGSILIFPAHLLHASSNPITAHERICINLVVTK